MVAEGQEEKAQALLSSWADFLIRFFFAPDSVGVTGEHESNSCGAPNAGLMGGMFVCFNGAGDIMKAAWEKYHDHGDELLSYFPIEHIESWAHALVFEGASNPNIPDGRAADSPPAGVRHYMCNIPYGDTSVLSSGQLLMFPMDALVNKREELIPILVSCVSTGKCAGDMYIMGGKIPSADDGMNALPVHRRHGGFLMVIDDPGVRHEFHKVFYGVGAGEAVTGDKFPGYLCHNHASPDTLTPLKQDWTQLCDPRWSKEEQEEKCYSYQEAAWGTEILKKLESIHSEVDPYHLFDCWDCVGYDEEEVTVQGPVIGGSKKKVSNLTSAILQRQC